MLEDEKKLYSSSSVILFAILGNKFQTIMYKTLGRIVTKILILFTFILSFLPIPAFSSNLKQVFQDAFDNDPTFKIERQRWLANEQELPIARSALLPQLGLIGQLYKQRSTFFAPEAQLIVGGATGIIQPSTVNDTGKTYTLTLSQTIFNYSQWAAVKNAKAIVKQAVATFDAAFQDLMTRTADAYFLVLNSSDNLRFKKAQEKELANKLEQNRERYKVGLIAITDVYDTQAQYEQVIAERIEAQNALENNLENLRAITGKIYPNLQAPGDDLPLLTPNPQNIEQWVEVAKRQNYTFLAAHFGAAAAKEQIAVQFGQGLPQLEAEGSYFYQKDSNFNATGIDEGPATQRNRKIALNLNYPIYQGGLVLANTRKANHIFQSLDAEKERTLRSVIADTRKSYLGVISGMSQVKAYKQSIISSQSALKSSEAGYLVGIKTILDVLIAQSNLYENQKSYAEQQYSYLSDILRLKKAAGTLSTADIEEMNSWLNRTATFSDSYLVRHTLKEKKTQPTARKIQVRLPKPKIKIK